MTTSPEPSFLSPFLDCEAIPADRLAYFRARLQARFYELVLTEFLSLERDKKISRIDLARRLDKDPSQITRLFAAPGNWTLDTVSDLFLAVLAAEPEIGVAPLGQQLVHVEAGKEEWVCGALNVKPPTSSTASAPQPAPSPSVAPTKA